MTIPVVLAFVSGKGGVGKTMLAVAFSNEIARGTKTLLFDLDFFNRGATGLFASAVEGAPETFAVPPFLPEMHDRIRPSESRWIVAEVRRNFCVLSYGEADPKYVELSAATDISAFSQNLRAYVSDVAAQCGCDVVVLDCHGGPDSASFAACLIADRVIMVSEPDKITLHGTFNFLRRLAEVSGSIDNDTRLIFNKVISGFSSVFLFSFYNRFMRGEFSGKRLLAIYPLEVYLTKEFEKTPFLTSVYPTSQLAIKTRVALHDLFGESKAEILSASVTNRSSLYRFYHRYTLGRKSAFVNPDFILRATAIASLAILAPPAIAQRLFYASWNDLIASYLSQLIPPVLLSYELVGQLIVSVGFFWLLFALFVNWIRDLDSAFTYYARAGHYIRAGINASLLTLLSGPPMVGVGAITRILTENDSNIWGTILSVGIVSLGAVYLIRYAARGVRNISIDSYLGEGTFRIVFSLGMLTVAGIAYWLRWLS